MKWTSAIAIYFIIWWMTLFVVLPFGVKNAAETGENVEQGNDEIFHGRARGGGSGGQGPTAPVSCGAASPDIVSR